MGIRLACSRFAVGLALAFALEVLPGALASAAKPWPMTVDFFQIRSEETGQLYTVAAVHSAGPLINEGRLQAAQTLALRAHNWLIDLFERKYPDIDPAIFETMRTEDSPLVGERPPMVIVFKGEDLNDIQSTARWVYRSEERPSLPMETAMHASFPAGPAQLVDYPELARDGTTKRTRSFAYGDAELKGLGVAEDTVDDPLPALFFAASRVGFDHSKHWFDMTPELRAQWDAVPKSALKRSPWRPGYVVKGIANPAIGRTNEYKIRCNQALSRYYSRWGFTPIQPAKTHGEGEPQMKTDVALGLDRETYISKMLGKFLRTRKGYRLWNSQIAGNADPEERIQVEFVSGKPRKTITVDRRAAYPVTDSELETRLLKQLKLQCFVGEFQNVLNFMHSDP